MEVQYCTVLYMRVVGKWISSRLGCSRLIAENNARKYTVKVGVGLLVDQSSPL